MIYSQFWKGESKSKYEQSGFNDTSNLDIHSEIGTCKAQLALTSESTTPNENCIIATVNTGDVYFFSTESGKTWKRAASDNSYSLVNTNSNGAHTGAKYHDGILYYVASNKLGKFDLASTWTDSFGTLSATPTYAPMFSLNLSLFIGAGAFIDAVDNTGTYAANALDLPAGFQVTTLNSTGFDLIIGTIQSSEVSNSKVFVWDTYSPSWTIEDDIDEIGVNAFIKSDNTLFAQCGTEGNIYYWTGSSLKKFGKIRGVTTAPGHYKTVTFKGKPLIGIGTKIYSIHREYEDLPYAICNEYTVTQGTVQGIGSGDGELLISNGENIDKIGTNRATATLDTPLTEGSFQRVVVNYESLPTGTSIGIGTDTDGDGSFTTQTPIIDTISKKVYFDGGLGEVNFLQAQITLNPNGVDTPIIRSISIE